MSLLKRVSDALEETESKKWGLRRSLLTLMVEWKDFEQQLDLTQTCFKECFNELESREKHLTCIQESVTESSKELDLIRQSLNEKSKEIEDKESKVLAYIDDMKLREEKISEAIQQLKLREEKLNEKDKLIQKSFEEKYVAVENLIGWKEKQFKNRGRELDSKEEKLKQQENEFKVREEILSSLKHEVKLKAKASDLRNKRERTTWVEPNVGCSSSSREEPLKRSKSSEYDHKEDQKLGIAVDDTKVGSYPIATLNADMVVKENKNVLPKESLAERDISSRKQQLTRQSSGSKLDTDYNCTGLEVWCPPAEFHDFDKDKEERNFEVDQIWACYDTLDGMPRLYAQVKKVLTPGFKLQMVWLEVDPEDQGETNDLQVGCGRFRLGSSLDITNHLVFSHEVQYKRDMQAYYLIYPLKGETWALYGDRDIRQSSEAEKHRQFKYEIVEVLSDFVHDVGIRVNYLDKVGGFASIFTRRRRGTVDDSFVIQANELYKFSHKVPSCQLKDTTGECLVEEAFELDPASLPDIPNNTWYHDKVKVEAEEVDDVSTLK